MEHFISFQRFLSKHKHETCLLTFKEKNENFKSRITQNYYAIYKNDRKYKNVVITSSIRGYSFLKTK